MSLAADADLTVEAKDSDLKSTSAADLKETIFFIMMIKNLLITRNLVYTMTSSPGKFHKNCVLILLVIWHTVIKCPDPERIQLSVLISHI